jgi:hypothetical protein
MAGFFDKLIGSEAAPEDRDYKTRAELSSPEEQQAYQAGEETSNIPGLDYAKSLFRGLGREVSGADMGSQVGQQYQQEIEAHRQRQAEAERLRQAYPEAYRGGQNIGSESIPNADLVFMGAPSVTSAARGMMRGAGPSAAETAVKGEITPALSDMESYGSVNPPTIIDRSITPSERGTMAKYYGGKGTGQYGPYVPGQRTGVFNVEDFGGFTPAEEAGSLGLKVRDNSKGWNLYDRPNYGTAPEGASPSWGSKQVSEIQNSPEFVRDWKNDAKSLDQLIRMYRGEGGDFMNSEVGGNWFTTDLNKARRYAKNNSDDNIVFGDYTRKEIGTHGASVPDSPDEWHFSTSNKDLRNRLKKLSELQQNESPISHNVMDLHQQRLADINSRLNPSLRMPARSFLGTKDMETNLARAEGLNPELVNAIAERQGAKGALPHAYAVGRLGEVTPIARGPEQLTGAFPRPNPVVSKADQILRDLNARGNARMESVPGEPMAPADWRARMGAWMPEGEYPYSDLVAENAGRTNRRTVPLDAPMPAGASANKVRNLDPSLEEHPYSSLVAEMNAKKAAQAENASLPSKSQTGFPTPLARGSVEEAPGALNFGLKREGYQQPKRRFTLPSALSGDRIRKALEAAETGAKAGTALGIMGVGAALPGAIDGLRQRTAQNAQQNAPGELPLWNPNIKSDVGPQTMAGRYGVEPIPVVANIPKDEPAAEPKAAPKATPKAQPKAAPKRAAQKRAAPRSAGKSAPQSNQKYWGDWRDDPGFADDPIGSFIDSITGQQKRAAKPGKTQASRPLDLGSLFSDGGMVRKHYEDGGAEDRIPIVSDIGDALGGLFQGGEQPVVAKDKAPAEEPAQSSQGLGGLNDFFQRWSTNPLSQLLFASGAATMGSPSTNPWQATGEGFSRGLEYMQAAQANQERLREKEEARRERLRQRKILEGLDNPEPVTAPIEKTAETEPEVVAPNTKVAESEPAVNAPVVEPKAPVEAPVSAPKTPVEAPGQPVTGPVVAADDGKINSLYALHNKIGRAMGSVTDPQLRMALASKQRNVEFEIQRLENQRKAEEDRAQKLVSEKRLQEQEKRLAKAADPYNKATEKFLGKQAEELASSMKDYTEVQAPKAESQLPVVDSLVKEFESAIKEGRQPNVYTSPTTFEAAKIAYNNFGITGAGVDVQKLTNTQKLSQLNTIDTLQKVGGSLGAQISDSDRELIGNAAVAIGLTPKEELERLKVLKGALKRQTQIADLMTKYAKEHGGVLDKDWPAYLEEHLPRKNMFNEETYKTFGVNPGERKQSPKARSPYEEEMLRRGKGFE